MPRWLKRGMDASAIKAADAKVRADGRRHPRRHRDARRRGGARPVGEVRQLVAGRLRLSPQEIEQRHRRRSPTATSTTSRFAQAQVRNFAAEAARHA